MTSSPSPKKTPLQEKTDRLDANIYDVFSCYINSQCTLDDLNVAIDNYVNHCNNRTNRIGTNLTTHLEWLYEFANINGIKEPKGQALRAIDEKVFFVIELLLHKQSRIGHSD